MPSWYGRATGATSAPGWCVGEVSPCGLAGDRLVVAEPGAFAPPVGYCWRGAAATRKIHGAGVMALPWPRILDVTERAT
jgi:hypothetical protein